MRRLVLLLAFICLVFGGAALAFAQSDLPARQEEEMTPFRKSYWAIELTRNFPASYSQNLFSPGGYFPTIRYLHNLDANWMMGVGGGFKMLNRRPETAGAQLTAKFGPTLAILTLSHETLYVVRLYHPTYLLLGPRLLYMLPTTAARLPFQRDPYYASEIGGAFTAQLVRLVGERGMLTFRVGRWRGTKTTRLQGFEAAIGYAMSMD